MKKLEKILINVVFLSALIILIVFTAISMYNKNDKISKVKCTLEDKKDEYTVVQNVEASFKGKTLEESALEYKVSLNGEHLDFKDTFIKNLKENLTEEYGNVEFTETDEGINMNVKYNKDDIKKNNENDITTKEEFVKYFKEKGYTCK